MTVRPKLMVVAFFMVVCLWSASAATYLENTTFASVSSLNTDINNYWGVFYRTGSDAARYLVSIRSNHSTCTLCYVFQNSSSMITPLVTGTRATGSQTCILSSPLLLNASTTYFISYGGTPICTHAAYDGISYPISGAVGNFTAGGYNLRYDGTITYAVSVFDVNQIEIADNVTVTPTLQLRFINEETNEVVSDDTITVTIIAATEAVNHTTTHGNINLTSFPSGEVELRYTGTKYTQRAYYLTYTQLINNLSLYLVPNATSSLTVLQVMDEKGMPLYKGKVMMQRYFIDCNCYRTVAMENIDHNGVSGIYLIPNSVYYQFLLTNSEGTLVGQYSPQKIFSSTLLLNAYLAEDVLRSYVAVRDSVSASLVWNNATDLITYTWADSSGIVTGGCIRVRERSLARETLYGPSCNTGQIGSTTLNLSGQVRNATYMVEGYLETSTTYSEPVTNTLIREFRRTYEYFGKSGLYLGMLTIGSMFLLGLFAGGFSAALMLMAAAMLLLQVLQIISLGWTLVVGFIIVGIVVAVVNKI